MRNSKSCSKLFGSRNWTASHSHRQANFASYASPLKICGGDLWPQDCRCWVFSRKLISVAFENGHYLVYKACMAEDSISCLGKIQGNALFHAIGGIVVLTWILGGQ